MNIEFMDYATFQKNERMRNNPDVNNRTIKTKKKSNAKRVANLITIGLLTAATVFVCAYSKTKSDMQEKEVIDPSGYMSVGNGTEPTFEEVINEMFGRGK